MTDGPAHVIDYGAFQQPTSPLFRDYVAGRPQALSFFGGGWDEAAVLAAAERTATHPRERQAVAAALVRQQQERGAATAAARAALLAEPQTVAVVTGQQAGLFGGPLYVLYKAVAALKTARWLERRRGRPAVAVFWVASDDHDFAEVRSSALIDDAGRIRTLRYAPRQEPVGQPAWGIRFDDTLSELLLELGAALPGGLHRDEALRVVADCYRPGVSLAAAFARLLSALMPELVVLEPQDAALKALLLPLWRREILEGSPSSELALQVGRALLAAGYHQQVPVRPGFLNLFVIMEGQRRALAAADGTLEVRGLGLRLDTAEAARLLEADPSAWSPGVLLRPLGQDALLPTAAYFGGPAEIAYHAQIVPAYAHFGVPRPVVLPRPSLTLLEPAQARALEAEGLVLTDLEADPEGLLGRWAREAHPEIEAAFARAREAVERELEALERAVAVLDPTLRAAAEATRGRALHQVETLREKSMRALKRRDQTRAERLRRSRDALFPGGALQERGLGLLGLIARHGSGILAALEERIDPFARGHQVLQL